MRPRPDSPICWTTACTSRERLFPPAAHKVRDNLLGNKDFCPIIRRTKTLTDFGSRALGEKANEIIGHTGANVVARSASFLLLADSRASFEIEGEKPPRKRLERWGRAVVQAGKNKLTLDEILRLHTVLIEDTRFTQAGLRPDGVFLGDRDPEGDPLPEFIGARPQDLQALMRGLIAANERMRERDLDTVLQATATAFGFVYIHLFQGRQRAPASLPNPSRPGRAKIHAAGDGVPCLAGHARPDRDIPRHAARAFGAADGLH